MPCGQRSLAVTFEVPRPAALFTPDSGSMYLLAGQIDGLHSDRGAWVYSPPPGRGGHGHLPPYYQSDVLLRVTRPAIRFHSRSEGAAGHPIQCTSQSIACSQVL
jgi:hypothetical protein